MNTKKQQYDSCGGWLSFTFSQMSQYRQITHLNTLHCQAVYYLSFYYFPTSFTYQYVASWFSSITVLQPPFNSWSMSYLVLLFQNTIIPLTYLYGNRRYLSILARNMIRNFPQTHYCTNTLSHRTSSPCIFTYLCRMTHRLNPLCK